MGLFKKKPHAANSEGATNFSQGATCSLHAHVLLVSLFHLLQGVSYCFVSTNIDDSEK